MSAAHGSGRQATPPPPAAKTPPMSDSFLALDIPEQPAAAQPYRVLARKYRPQTFSQLIGQDAMVTTLGNAIKRGRLAHAFC